MEEKLAAQLYTLREELKKGVRPVFKELKQMGWAAVQLSALPDGYDPEEIAALLKEFELSAAGIHISLEQLESDFASVLAEVNAYNTRDIICPYLPDSLRDEAGYQHVKTVLNELSDRAPEKRISYHNHDFEFKTEINGQSALEFLLEPGSNNQLLAEIDVYWIKKAGKDPLSFIQPYKNRMPIIHLKDMTNDERRTFAEIGTGVIDFLPILKWGEASGVEWYAVEQDQCDGDPMRCLELSLLNLKNYIKLMSA